MSPGVRAARHRAPPDLDHGKGPDEQVTFGESSSSSSRAKWYSVLVEVQGNEVLAQIGDDIRFYGQHEVFGREKVELQLTSGGQDDVFYRNVRVGARALNLTGRRSSKTCLPSGK